MGSSFFEFHIASTALFAAKAGIANAANNAANAATEGYSRQYIKQTTASPLNSYSSVGQVGTGTVVYGNGQIRDVYLDKKYWPQVSTLGEYGQKYSNLSFMETCFSSLSSSSMLSNVTDFFDALSSLSFDSNSIEFKTSVVSNAESLITSLQLNASSLREQQIDINEEIYSLVERVNSIGNQISAINERIYQYELYGNECLELRDQRALLIDELSQYVNVEVKEYSDNSGRELGLQYAVLINGQEFVNHNTYNTLECVRRTDEYVYELDENGDQVLDEDGNPILLEIITDDVNAPGMYDICWSTGSEFNLTGASGEIKGLVDVRDGDGTTGEYKGIPYYLDKLNEFARTIAYAFNTGLRYSDDTQLEGVIGHQDGYDSYGETGVLFFTMIDSETGETINDPELIDYENLNIFNLAINSDLIADPNKLASSSSEDMTDVSNNEVILGFLNLKDDGTVFSEGSFYQFANALATTLAIDTNQADSFTEYYTSVTETIQNQRLQVSGVSLNEEVTAMIQYQYLYQAAAKLMNVISEIYETTIKGLG